MSLAGFRTLLYISFKFSSLQRMCFFPPSHTSVTLAGPWSFSIFFLTLDVEIEYYPQTDDEVAAGSPLSGCATKHVSGAWYQKCSVYLTEMVSFAL
jgi:hypothetical protein